MSDQGKNYQVYRPLITSDGPLMSPLKMENEAQRALSHNNRNKVHDNTVQSEEEDPTPKVKDQKHLHTENDLNDYN